MLSTYLVSKLPIPGHIAVMRGVWYERANLQDTLEWARGRLANPALPLWDRKFLRERCELIGRSLAQ